MDINPVLGSILQAPVVEQQQMNEKVRELRRKDRLARNVAATEGELVHEVEDSGRIEPIHEDRDDESQRQRRQSMQHKPDDGDHTPHLDVTA